MTIEVPSLSPIPFEAGFLPSSLISQMETLNVKIETVGTKQDQFDSQMGEILAKLGTFESLVVENEALKGEVATLKAKLEAASVNPSTIVIRSVPVTIVGDLESVKNVLKNSGISIEDFKESLDLLARVLEIGKYNIDSGTKTKDYIGDTYKEIEEFIVVRTTFKPTIPKGVLHFKTDTGLSRFRESAQWSQDGDFWKLRMYCGCCTSHHDGHECAVLFETKATKVA